MSSLGDKTAQHISALLDEYGIKHGPVVDSTRSLYEKKLKEAMAKEKKFQPSSDKTYYREEENVTYVYTTPVRNEGSSDRTTYMRPRPEWSEREYDHKTSYSRPNYGGWETVDEPQMYDSPSTYRSSYLQSTPLRGGQDAPKAEKSSRLVPLWVQLVVFLVLAVFLYFVFSNMETNEFLKEIGPQ
ncbi:emerin-like isoform X2 [Gouania willdenowi]|uniref:emerin-like isoform X2 n=1 Tax=Gouania willdenowi TaxID=441366 RepID=UPI0010565550|nr:emerin-like isoform X2 [Gouania willdenowi]